VDAAARESNPTWLSLLKTDVVGRSWEKGTGLEPKLLADWDSAWKYNNYYLDPQVDISFASLVSNMNSYLWKLFRVTKASDSGHQPWHASWASCPSPPGCLWAVYLVSCIAMHNRNMVLELLKIKDWILVYQHCRREMKNTYKWGSVFHQVSLKNPHRQNY
jgi:hypothetical protein